MARRIHVQHLRPGEAITLDAAEAHHARDVLRLRDGATVEVFDDSGAVGEGVFTLRGDEAFVRVEQTDLRHARGQAIHLIVAAAVPKGDRADWMVEKLSELGVDEFIPVAAARSVVLPGGRGKRDRWLRIATEAAKQSRRPGVMRITELTPLGEVIRRATVDKTAPNVAGAGSFFGSVWFLSTEASQPTPISRAVVQLTPGGRLTTFIGPEGGWTAQEQQQFGAAGVTPVRLTPTVLRIETAAVTAAAVVLCSVTSRSIAPLDGPVSPDDDPPAGAAAASPTPPAGARAPTTGTPP